MQATASATIISRAIESDQSWSSEKGLYEITTMEEKQAAIAQIQRLHRFWQDQVLLSSSELKKYTGGCYKGN